MKAQQFMTCFSLPKTLGNEQCLKLLLGVCNTKKDALMLIHHLLLPIIVAHTVKKGLPLSRPQPGCH
jgi:hypothetical protein